ncbi:MAG: serine/threonine protein kinase [Planctomycetes bacterium]|nr:serine/threonine protein kinase [Planctomycetota bacterium]
MVDDPWIGSVVGGVILLSRLGSGSMGVVYRGRSEALDRHVAVKFIREDNTAEERGRFLREGRAAAKVANDHVVRVFATGEVGDNLYIILELVEGETLAQRIERDGALDPWMVGHIGVECALGLAAIHQVGIIHRDIKPDNILIGLNGRAKISDLGLAKVPDEAGLTRTRAVVGTPLYVAPEAVLDPRAITAAADIYGLGGTLYHAVAGKPAFDLSEPSAIIRAKLEDALVPLRQVRHGIPTELAQLIERCLERVPQLRPTADQLATDLSGIFMRLGRGR